MTYYGYVTDFLEAVNYRVTSGDEINWPSYGSDAYMLTHESGDGDIYVECGFSLGDGQIVELVLVNDVKKRAYRWIHPEYKDAIKKEYKDRGLQFKESGFDYNFKKVEDLWDLLGRIERTLEKTDASDDVVTPIDDGINSSFDDADGTVTLTLTNEEALDIMKYAHEQDLTLNQLVNKILRTELERTGVLDCGPL